MGTLRQDGLLVVGGGNMGGAIVRGGVSAGVLDAARVCVLEPDAGKRAVLRDELGVAVVESFGEGSECARAWLEAAPRAAVLMAIKPQVLPMLATQTRGALARRLVVSILAGVRLATLERTLGTARVVRAMPNLAASIGEGATALAAGAGASPTDVGEARALCGAVGPVVVELDEAHFDVFTALAGSGPAYVFALAEAMIAAARGAGLSEGQADAIVRQTVLGAARLLASDARSPAMLREAVTSKGGTTEAALAVLAARAWGDALGEAIRAGAARGAALEKIAGEPQGAEGNSASRGAKS